MNKLICSLLSLILLSGCSNNQKAIDFFKPEWERACAIQYKNENPEEDYWQTPKETEKLKTGDCEDISLYLKDLLDKKACDCTLEFGYMSNLGRMFKANHAWVECQFENKTYILDATNKTFERRFKNTESYLGLDDYTEREYAEEKMREYKGRIEN